MKRQVCRGEDRDPQESSGQNGSQSAAEPVCRLSAAAPARKDEPVHLTAHRRLGNAQAKECHLVYVVAGTLALDVILPQGRRQILDFLLPGDILPTDICMSSPGVSIRAITDAVVRRVDRRAPEPAEHGIEYCPLLATRLQSQLARANIHRLMIGHLDVVSRVASFLFAMALRSSAERRAELILPMSREDIADYLAMNPDTLSRIMMRFEALSFISRPRRRSIRVEDLAGLKNQTPIAVLLTAAFGCQNADAPSPQCIHGVYHHRSACPLAYNGAGS